MMREPYTVGQKLYQVVDTITSGWSQDFTGEYVHTGQVWPSASVREYWVAKVTPKGAWVHMGAAPADIEAFNRKRAEAKKEGRFYTTGGMLTTPPKWIPLDDKRIARTKEEALQKAIKIRTAHVACAERRADHARMRLNYLKHLEETFVQADPAHPPGP